MRHATLLAFAVPALMAQSPATEVTAAERAFAARAAVVGVRASFLEYFAEDSLLFQPKAENGPAHYRAQKEDGALLSWGPSFVLASSGGDWALSTGPWDYRAKPGEAILVSGHYLSIWRKEAKGPWKVLMDCGSSHPRQGDIPTEAQMETSKLRPIPKARAEAQLRTADAAMLELSQAKGTLAAYARFASPGLRIYRSGRLPDPIRATRDATLKQLPEHLNWTLDGLQMAPAGDLAFTYGTDNESRPAQNGRPAASSSSLVRIWRREADGSWKLAADQASPIPMETKQALPSE